MLAKVIVWALNWEDAVSRGQRALTDIRLEGIRTTIPYYLQILNAPMFRRGNFDTSFVDSHPDLIDYSCKRRREDLAAVLASAVAIHAGL